MNKKLIYILSGIAAGAVNGFFGTGGGMVLVPVFLHSAKLESKKALATSVAVIAPLCVLSLTAYIMRQSFDLSAALPFLAGGLIGGAVSGLLFKKLDAALLRRVFGALIIFGGIKALFL